VNQLTGSLRYGILSVIFFFIAGLVILPFVNVVKGMADVKKYEAGRTETE
jgi:UMF1 family MFS transporter